MLLGTLLWTDIGDKERLVEFPFVSIQLLIFMELYSTAHNTTGEVGLLMPLEVV